MLAKREIFILLYDFYGGLLTEKQRTIFDLYYQCDLSLGEIAQDQEVSRQAVYDIIKRTENTLEEYENKLGLVKKFMFSKDKLQKVLEILDGFEDSAGKDSIQDIVSLIKELINEV
ncbi:MAG: YlxM family DNA-binding protein [Peptococcaceae bacterium]